MKIQTIKQQQDTLLIAPLGKAIKLGANAFDVSNLRKQELITKEMTGRGVVYFFCWPSKKAAHTKTLALRHYKRGGLIAKLSDDQFVFTSLAKTRCYQELYILQYLQNNHVNVPTPVAAKVNRTWPFYRADLITEVIPNAQELHEMLITENAEWENPKIWRSIGEQIGKMHLANVFHGDINVKNILIQANNKHPDNPKVYLIDFDKCSLKASGTWQQNNLARLHRSLVKQQSQHAHYAFTDSDWQHLLDAYNDVLKKPVAP